MIDFSTIRQTKVVEDAMNAMKQELFVDWWPGEMVEHYINYVYSIGFHDGRAKRGKVVAQMNGSEVIETHKNATRASKVVGCDKSTIIMAANGKLRSGHRALGFTWYYV
jgi:hypothetical protein